MTIAKRLAVLVAVPLLVLIGLGIFVRVQSAEIEANSRIVKSEVRSNAVLGNISRSLAELRINVRSYLLHTDQAQKDKLRARRRPCWMTAARATLRIRATQPGSLADIVADLNRRLTADVGEAGSS